MTRFSVVALVLLAACGERTPRPEKTPAADADATAAAAPVTGTTGVPRGFRMRGDQIVADTFELRPELRDGQLTLALDTDLGDDTEVFVSVGRRYREEGSAEDFLVEYFNEAGPVGSWRAGRTIDLGKTDFWAEIEKLERAMALQGAPFRIASTSDDLEIAVRVYPAQGRPFRRGNANLMGKAVRTVGLNHVIEKDTVIRYPVIPRQRS